MSPKPIVFRADYKRWLDQRNKEIDLHNHILSLEIFCYRRAIEGSTNIQEKINNNIRAVSKVKPNFKEKLIEELKQKNGQKYSELSKKLGCGKDSIYRVLKDVSHEKIKGKLFLKEFN